MTPLDWLLAGYNKFSTKDSVTHKFSDYGLQKRIDNERGTKYFISVYVYEEKYINGVLCKKGFSPTVQFHLEFQPTVDMEFILKEDSTIFEVEEMINSVWITLGCPYYEKWS